MVIPQKRRAIVTVAKHKMETVKQLQGEAAIFEYGVDERLEIDENPLTQMQPNVIKSERTKRQQDNDDSSEGSLESSQSKMTLRRQGKATGKKSTARTEEK